MLEFPLGSVKSADEPDGHSAPRGCEAMDCSGDPERTHRALLRHAARRCQGAGGCPPARLFRPACAATSASSAIEIGGQLNATPSPEAHLRLRAEVARQLRLDGCR